MTVSAVEFNNSLGLSARNIMAIQALVGASPDGVMGPKTVAKITEYQYFYSLEQDGKIGPRTAYILGRADQECLQEYGSDGEPEKCPNPKRTRFLVRRAGQLDCVMGFDIDDDRPYPTDVNAVMNGKAWDGGPRWAPCGLGLRHMIHKGWEGSYHEDRSYAQRLDHWRGNGGTGSIYGWFRPDQNVKKQAAHALKVIKRAGMIYGPVWIDLEKHYGRSPDQVQAAFYEMAKRLQDGGAVVGLYTGDYFEDKYGLDSVLEFPRWLARYPSDKQLEAGATCEDPWAAWQATSSAAHPCFNNGRLLSRFDLNLIKSKDHASWDWWSLTK